MTAANGLKSLQYLLGGAVMSAAVIFVFAGHSTGGGPHPFPVEISAAPK